jgi:HEAT repeats
MGRSRKTKRSKPLTLNFLRCYALAFVVLAVVSGVAGFRVGHLKSVWAKLDRPAAPEFAATAASLDTPDPIQADYESVSHLAPQQQAEGLLDGAIHRRQGSLDLIHKNVDSWRGRVQNTDHLFDLVLTALKSDDLRVRAAAIEVDLAANDLSKSPKSIARLLRQIRDDSNERPWALWRLGGLGNRGVQPKLVLSRLIAFAHDRDEQTRFWAVEGLAMLGSDASVDPLLDRFAHDPSPRVRQRAACSLAQSGMLTREQRLAAVPDLLNFLDDDALDSDTRSWVYGALRMITGEPLGNDAHDWQQWWTHHDNTKKPHSPRGVVFA